MDIDIQILKKKITVAANRLMKIQRFVETSRSFDDNDVYRIQIKARLYRMIDDIRRIKKSIRMIESIKMDDKND